MTLAGSTSAPLLLLGKRLAPVELKIASAPLNLNFCRIGQYRRLDVRLGRA